MKGLKTVLWVCGGCFLLGFIGLVAPWPWLVRMFEMYGVAPPVVGPLEAYMIRMLAALIGIVGVFFLVLALHPERYAPMVFLAATGLILFCVFTLAGGIHYRFPARVFLPDTLFLGTTGTLILVLAVKAFKKGV